jgi:hypothetical protein
MQSTFSIFNRQIPSTDATKGYKAPNSKVPSSRETSSSNPKQSCSTSILKPIKHSSVKGDSQQSTGILTILATSRFIQRFRFHLLFGARFGAVAAVTNWLLMGLLIQTSSTWWTHSTSWLLRTSVRSLLVSLGALQVMPAFIGLTVSRSEVIYWVLLLAQWFVAGFGISFLFRSRYWFFNSTLLFWLLFPLTFVPLIVTSSGMKYWCGFGVGQPWEWLYYCEDHGATFLSVTAFFEDLSVGMAGVILVWQLTKFAFGRQRGIESVGP